MNKLIHLPAKVRQIKFEWSIDGFEKIVDNLNLKPHEYIVDLKNKMFWICAAHPAKGLKDGSYYYVERLEK